MAIPGSGPVSLDDIQTEFGGTNPISLSEYYGADTGVPASGTISVSDFYGTSSSDVTMDTLVFGSLGPGDDSASDTVSGINQAVTLGFDESLSNGFAFFRINGGTQTIINGINTAVVNNGDTVTLEFQDTSQSGTFTYLNGGITVRNQTDGNVIVGSATVSSWDGDIS